MDLNEQQSKVYVQQNKRLHFDRKTNDAACGLCHFCKYSEWTGSTIFGIYLNCRKGNDIVAIEDYDEDCEDFLELGYNKEPSINVLG